MNKKINFIDLFAGCGGIAKGFSDAGMECVAANEFDKNAATTYRNNFNHPLVEGDITAPEVKQRLYDLVGDKEVDVAAGGFPCQGFSMSGKRIIDDPRNKLFREFVEIVRVTRPKVVVGENVEGILSMGKGEVVKQIIEAFGELGYKMDCKVLNAADYGVPQLRKRVIFIGNRLGVENVFPKPVLTPDEYITVKDAIGDLVGHGHDEKQSHLITASKPETLARMKEMKEGEAFYKTRRDSCRKLFWERPAPTVKDNHGNWAVHPVDNRYVTPREMARLQSFPDSFDFSHVAKKYQLRQIGNAVPPLMAQHIAMAVRRMIEGK
ncbi:MAG: DNA cytosine methyltransferase [Prevotella sp.]|nr:DNA cytosine methyltransferase [Prevotella sp.]